MDRSDLIYESLLKMYPDAHCQLDYGSDFQLAVAVLLSAQTTDVSVNTVTKQLFARYPDARSLSEAPLEEMESIIRQLGLFHAKARNIRQMASEIVRRHNGVLPKEFDELTHRYEETRAQLEAVQQQAHGKKSRSNKIGMFIAARTSFITGICIASSSGIPWRVAL